MNADQQGELSERSEFSPCRHSSVRRRETVIALAMAGGELRGAGGPGGPAAGPRAAMRGRVPAVYRADMERNTLRRGPALVDFGLAHQDRGVSPPHGDVLLSGDKSTQKRLLLAEGMSDSCARRHCQADTGAALFTFCGAHPLGAPRLTTRHSPVAQGTNSQHPERVWPWPAMPIPSR
jgi:hypothetical protein